MAKTKEKEKASGPRARNDAYVMMLFITFVAIVTGTVLMYLDAEEYSSKTPPPAPKIGEITADKGGGPAAGGAAAPPAAKEKEDGAPPAKDGKAAPEKP